MISTELLKNVQRNLSPEEVEWRAGNKDSKNSRVRVLPYISARCANDRLLELGLENVQIAFSQPYNLVYDIVSKDYQTKVETITTRNDAGIICKIGLKFKDGWNWYEDGSDIGDNEPFKAMLSDAKKRACVVVGIGRDLYNYPAVFLAGLETTIPSWAYAKFNEITTAFNEGKVTAKYIILKENEPVNFEAHVEKQFINHNGEPSFMKAKELIQKGEIKNETELEAKFIFAKGTKSPADQLKMDKAKKELIALFA